MDSDSDDNQSQEMFSDDELVTNEHMRDSLTTDISFVSYSQLSSKSSDSSPINNKLFDSAAIPATPLSLNPFISKAEVWSSDLETPQLKKPNQRKCICIENTFNETGFRIINEKPIVKSSTVLNNSIMDETIPASQTISVEKGTKQLGHMTKNNSNNTVNTSKFDERFMTQDMFENIEKADTINVFSIGGEKLFRSNVNFPYEEVNELDSIMLAKRVGYLKTLQNQRTKNITRSCIPNAEFVKTLKSLMCAQKFIDDHHITTEKSFHSQSEFTRSSQILIDLNEKCSHNSNGNYVKVIHDEPFCGFSKKCQNETQVYIAKIHNYYYEKELQILNKSSKFYNYFSGFTTLESDKSYNIAKMHKFIYEQYLDDNDRLFAQPVIKSTCSQNMIGDCLLPLWLPLSTGIKTAHGDEIFIDIDIVYKSKLSYIENERDISKRSVDELVTNKQTQYVQFENRDTDNVMRNCTNILHNFNDIHHEIIESKSKVIIDNYENINLFDGFKSTRGICSHISEQAMIQANKIFNEENNINIGNQTGNSTWAKSTSISMKEPVSKHHYNFIPCHQPNSNIPCDKISKIQDKYQDENDLFANNSKVNPAIEGFQTGLGKSINISTDALLKAKNIFAKDIENNTTPVGTSISFCQKENFINMSKKVPNIVVNKRKHPVDDETPVGRKKIRTGTDLQRRKLFLEIEAEDNYLSESVLLFNDKDNIKTDRDNNCLLSQGEKSTNDIITKTNPPNPVNIISDEVRESIAALLKDEENSNESQGQWTNNPTDIKSLNNRKSDGSCRYKCDKNLEKKSRSYPGSGSNNKCGESIDVKSLVYPNNILTKPSLFKYDDIPEDVYFDSPFSEECIDSYTIEQNRQKRSVAITKQQELIEFKKKNRVHQIIQGSLLCLKEMNDNIQLSQLFDNILPVTRTPEELSQAGIDPSVLFINAVTAINYKFQCINFFGQTFMNDHYDGIPVGDNAILVPNNDNSAGVNEFKQCFLASPGVNPSLVPNGYVENHYRWIVWKLASMERLKLDKSMNIKFLTPDRIMRQLKYRYDREIDRSQRSALRRILEKDDLPSRRLVLCVSKIFVMDNDERDPTSRNNQRTIELTDGWYSVCATIDYAMLDYIKTGKVNVGTKLMIYGAELLNLDEGCYPLDITNKVRLKIHTNSTRRVKWYVKLGYQRRSGPMECTLKSINSNGGLIGKFTVVVARVYPIIYREKIGGGQFIDRNARCEEKVSIAHEAECQLHIEALYAKNKENMGEEWKTEMENREMNGLLMRRDVTPIIRIKVTDGDCAGLLTIWPGTEELQSVFRENTYLTIHNALASGKKLSELQITANRHTIFKKISMANISHARIICLQRTFTPLNEICRPEFNPHYGEFDTIGIIVSTGPAPHGMRNFETVNLAFIDEENNQAPSYYLSILFWQGISSYGLTEIANVGSFIACSNLEWRKNTYKSIPTAFCTDRTILTQNPKQNHLCQPFEDLRERIKDLSSYITFCALEIRNEILKKSKLVSTSENNTLYSEPKNSPYSTPRQPNLILDDTGSNDRSLVTTNNIPRSSSRSVEIKNRIDKLQNFGPATTLSPIYLRHTPKIALDYRSPILHPYIASIPQSK